MTAGTTEPAVERRRLRIELRRLRQDRELKQTDVASAMEWSPSKVIRIEHGDVNISAADLRVLLDFYGATDRLDELLAMARAAKQQPSWTEYRDVHSRAYLTYLGFESSAKLIRTYQPTLVPGLLQTEEYARAVLSGTYQDSPDVISKRWEARQRRQELHERTDPPRMAFVMDEAVVRRKVGGAATMRRQLQRLREWADEDHVTIQVIPFAVGAHPGMTGPFMLLDFPDPADDDFLFLEDQTGESRSLDEPEETTPYLERFFRLEQVALSPERSADFLEQIIGETGSEGGDS